MGNHIRELRLTVRRVIELLATYPDREELHQEFPELEDEDIRQALVFVSCYLDHEFQRWYPPRDLSVESIPNRKLVRSRSRSIENPQERAFIRGVASKI